mmetsp:Transcript_74015/g.204249  ORF Transcript_74015/g.204249 Transcript_74015/m.204249 type:complete len:272 (-) Transcript_74015:271-1086(-)
MARASALLDCSLCAIAEIQFLIGYAERPGDSKEEHLRDRTCRDDGRERQEALVEPRQELLLGQRRPYRIGAVGAVLGQGTFQQAEPHPSGGDAEADPQTVRAALPALAPPQELLRQVPCQDRLPGAGEGPGGAPLLLWQPLLLQGRAASRDRARQPQRLEAQPRGLLFRAQPYVLRPLARGVRDRHPELTAPGSAEHEHALEQPVRLHLRENLDSAAHHHRLRGEPEAFLRGAAEHEYALHQPVHLPFRAVLQVHACQQPAAAGARTKPCR